MAPEPTPSKGGGLMSLYANLLDPSAESPGTISRAPVVFKQGAEADAQSDESAAKKQQVNAGTYHSSFSQNNSCTHLFSFSPFPTHKKTPARSSETETETFNTKDRALLRYPEPYTCTRSTSEKHACRLGRHRRR